jgi:head-tail adaptor
MKTKNYRETGVIERAIQGRNSLGETIENWVEFAPVRASVTETGSSEQTRRGQVDTTISHLVSLRFVPGVRSKMRFRWTSGDNRLLYIASVLIVGFRFELELQCEEQAT